MARAPDACRGATGRMACVVAPLCSGAGALTGCQKRAGSRDKAGAASGMRLMVGVLPVAKVAMGGMVAGPAGVCRARTDGLSHWRNELPMVAMGWADQPAIGTMPA